MKVLVTGGAGFIGSHVADALLKAGHEVHILDNLNGGFTHNIPENAFFHEMDIRDEEVVQLWEKHQFEVLYHLAAQMDVRTSVRDPKYDADINVLGFINLMEAGRVNGLKKVIFSSTGGAIYGEPEYTPQDEDHTQQPLSPYGITKLVTERYLFFYEKTHDIDWVALRYANVFGPRQNAHGEAGVIAIFTERMLRNQQAYINGDGKQTRDYVYIDDVVQANMKALDYGQSGIFNVGTEVETDVIELFETLQKLTGTSIQREHAEGKPGEQQRSVVGTQKIQDELGWKQQFDLEKGLEITVDWFKQKMEAQAN
jgi:UDP-glucose 4-epimerase